MEEYTNYFKALSGRMRLRIIRLLLGEASSLCVCEIIDSLCESQYNISRNLRYLKNAGFLEEKKEGRWVYYSLVKAEDEFHKFVLQAVAKIPEKNFMDENKRLKERLSLRQNGVCVAGMQSEGYYQL